MELLINLIFQDHSWEVGVYVVASLIGTALGILHVPSVLLRRSDRPMSQLAWILCLLTLPYIGVFFWWIIGRSHLKRRTRKRKVAISTITQKLSTMRASMKLELDDPREEDLLSVASDDIFHASSGNSVELLVRGGQAYDAFEKAVRDATDHIHFEFYIWQADETGRRFRDLLAEKAREGVEVRVLYDAVGGSAVKGSFMRPLVDAGAQVHSFLPLVLFERSLRINFRNHRKIIVIDNQVAFTGGVNIGDEYIDWFDVAFRFEGPVVNQFQEVFAEDWYFASGENLADLRYFRESVADSSDDSPETRTDATIRLLPSGPDQTRSVSKTSFFLALTMASQRIWLTTPYFVPDPSISMALQAAALRGLDVRLLLPGVSDVPVARIAGRGYFEELLEAGVRIFEYSPEVLHAKTLVIDDEWAIVGSANLDTRSFHLNFEANAAIRSTALAQDLSELIADCFEKSEEIDLERFAKRGTWARLRESAARLFSPLL